MCVFIMVRFIFRDSSGMMDVFIIVCVWILLLDIISVSKGENTNIWDKYW